MLRAWRREGNCLAVYAGFSRLVDQCLFDAQDVVELSEKCIDDFRIKILATLTVDIVDGFLHGPFTLVGPFGS